MTGPAPAPVQPGPQQQLTAANRRAVSSIKVAAIHCFYKRHLCDQCRRQETTRLCLDRRSDPTSFFMLFLVTIAAPELPPSWASHVMAQSSIKASGVKLENQRTGQTRPAAPPPPLRNYHFQVQHHCIKQSSLTLIFQHSISLAIFKQTSIPIGSTPPTRPHCYTYKMTLIRRRSPISASSRSLPLPGCQPPTIASRFPR